MHPDVLHRFYNGVAPFTDQRTRKSATKDWANRSETIAGSQSI
jgi:hypothetical protein